MRLNSLFASLLVLGSLGVAAEAQAQGVALSFSGQRSTRVARSVAQRLDRAGHQIVSADAEGDSPEEIAQSAGADLVVEAIIRRRGGAWRARVRVSDAAGTEIDTTAARARGLGGLGAQLARRIDAILQRAEPAAPPGPRRRVVVGDFEGPGGARVRNQIVRALARTDLDLVPRDDLAAAGDALGVDIETPEGLVTAAREMEVAAYVVGRNDRAGRRWTSEVEVRNGADGRVVDSFTFRGSSLGRLVASARRGTSAVERAVGQTSAPPPEESRPEPEPEPEPERPTGPIAEGVADDAGEQAYNALDISVGLHLFSRKLRYNDDLYGLLREYTLDLGPALLFRGRWYPVAHFSDMFLAHVGFDFRYERAFGIDSTRADGETFPTSSRAWYVGMRGRVPYGRQEFSFGLGYGLHNFVIEAAGPSQPGRLNIPQVPGVTYRFVKMQLEARLAPIAGLRVIGRAAYLILLDLGGVEEEIWFPRSNAGGVETELLLGWSFDAGFEVRLGWNMRRYFFSMNPEPGDPFIAGGALDQYFGYSLELAYRY
ncbi:MAG TPA: hypothetical protein RMH85_15965 [Polyangiaceae bacterium LLY-WYZ-15_(1-7)]|nr:hypothetical protein [Myxococcales bacterium]MAT29851.1 hypothetical protein [Sandaracinus sp.]HJL01146.1 hypothetical protein [Polyangiaceae bacterium LLY-WYZ-15_(1-7)]MBJ71058.1 hypothetical protein [Sandaracinus sp.]HJL09997.1 hypothetical protein [Polyangiaceae bacterium LLY-WYZ-15_(1-7)]